MHTAEKHARPSGQACADHGRDGGPPSQRSFTDAHPDSQSHAAATSSMHNHPQDVLRRSASTSSHEPPNLKSAIRAHLGQSSSTVPAKRKELFVSPIERQSPVEPIAHLPSNADSHIAKRARYTPPEQSAGAQGQNIGSLDSSSKASTVDIEQGASIHEKFPAEPPAELRPPPPPPLTPFTVPRTSPTALQPSVPPAAKRKKRALTFGPEGETSRDAPVIEDPSAQLAFQHDERRLTPSLASTKKVPEDVSAPTTKKEDSLPPLTAQYLSAKSKPSAANYCADITSTTKTETDQPLPSRWSQAKNVLDKAAASARGNSHKGLSPAPPARKAARSHNTHLASHASSSAASEAGPSSLSSLSATATPGQSRAQKATDRDRTLKQGTGRVGGLQNPLHEGAEARSMQQTSKVTLAHRPAKNVVGSNKRRTDEDDRRSTPGQKAKPQTQPRAQDESEPTKKRKKLLPLESIIQRSQQEQQAHERNRPEQSNANPKSQPPPAVPELAPATPLHVKDELEDHSLSIAGPSLMEESPRLVFAKKQASAELSFMNNAFSGGKSDTPAAGLRENSAHSLEALFMLADAAETKQASAVQHKAESHSSDARESSMDSARSMRDRAQQQAQKELMHTEDLPSLQNRPGPKPVRKLSEILDDEDTTLSEDAIHSDVTVRADDDSSRADKDAGLAAAQGLLGLAHYESSPEPEPLTDAPAGATQWMSTDSPGLSSATSDGQIRPDLPTSSALALATAGSQSSSLPVVRERKSTSRRVVLSPEPEPEMAHESSASQADSARQNAPPHADHVSPTVSRRRRSDSTDDETPAPPRKKTKPTPPPVENASPEFNPATETPAPAPTAPVRKKFANFKKTRQAVEAKEPTKELPKEKQPVQPPASTSTPSLPLPLAARPPSTQQPTTSYGRQLPPEHSSRDVDPTSVLSSVLGKPKRDANGITSEQRKAWDAKKAADRAAREAQYASSGPPLRMQRQMQTILKYEQKFKAKRANISPSVVAAAFRQQWEKSNKTTWQWPPRPNADRSSSGHTQRPLPAPSHNGYASEGPRTPYAQPTSYPPPSKRPPPSSNPPR